MYLFHSYKWRIILRLVEHLSPALWNVHNFAVLTHNHRNGNPDNWSISSHYDAFIANLSFMLCSKNSFSLWKLKVFTLKT